jgi:PAS domain S-box-containing protein
MEYSSKTKQEMIEEIAALKQRIYELEQSEAAQGQTEDDRLRLMLETLPAGLIIVDPITRIIEYVNETAAAMFGSAVKRIVGHRCHSFLCPANEGACPVCDLGNEVDNAERVMLCADGHQRSVLKSVKRIKIRGMEKLLECFFDITERKKMEKELENERRIRLQAALDEVKILRGIIPICSHCKKIRDDKGSWSQIEKYVSEHSEAQFSHEFVRSARINITGTFLSNEMMAQSKIVFLPFF